MLISPRRFNLAPPSAVAVALLAAGCTMLVLCSLGTAAATAGTCPEPTGSAVFELGITNTCNHPTSLTGSAWPSGLSVASSFPSVTALSGSATATTGQGTGVSGTTYSNRAFSYGVSGGLSNSSPEGPSAGVIGGTSSLGANGYGVYGLHNASIGTSPGVVGRTNSSSDDAIGVEGIVYPTVVGLNSEAVRGQNNGTGFVGIGVYGSQNGAGFGGLFTVPGPGQGVNGSAGNGGVGVFGYVGSGASQSYGVEGTANNNTAADSAGVYGSINSNAANAAGVRGYNSSASCCGMGVAGFHAGQGIGIYGEAPSGFAVSGFSPNNWSGYFQGDVRVVGTLTKTAGAFRIDNPLDPAHSYLQHSFVESPDMKNVYDGVTTTNGKGFATVRLPAWFQALNKGFRYQLTSLSGLQLVAVAKEISHNRFTIQSEKPNARVSWQVTGIRKDPYANAHRIQTVVPKTARADRRYVHPELYGKPLSKSVVVLPGMTRTTQPKFTSPAGESRR